MPYCTNCDDPEADHFAKACPKPKLSNTLEQGVIPEHLASPDIVERKVANECPVCKARRLKEKLKKRKQRLKKGNV